MDVNPTSHTTLFRAVAFVKGEKLYTNICVDEITATAYRDILRAMGLVAWVERAELNWKEI